jgi:DNA-binding NtrC family response regulator
MPTDRKPIEVAQEGMRIPPYGSFLDDDRSGPPGRLLPKETVLVVEDHTLVKDLAVSALRDAGYRVLHAECSRKAAELAREAERLDLLFADIVMPGGVNGITLAHQLISDRPDLKVLITTGYGEDSPAQMEAGIGFHFLQKPYRIHELQNVVRDILRND